MLTKIALFVSILWHSCALFVYIYANLYKMLHQKATTPEWGIPVKLVSFDGEFALVYIKNLVIRVGDL